MPRCRILQTTSTFKSKEIKEDFLTDLVDGCKTFRTEEQNSIQGVEIDAAPGFSSGSYLTTDTLPVNLVNHVKLHSLIFCGGMQQEQLHLWVSKQVHIRISFTCEPCKDVENDSLTFVVDAVDAAKRKRSTEEPARGSRQRAAPLIKLCVNLQAVTR